MAQKGLTDKIGETGSDKEKDFAGSKVEGKKGDNPLTPFSKGEPVTGDQVVDTMRKRGRRI